MPLKQIKCFNLIINNSGLLCGCIRKFQAGTVLEFGIKPSPWEREAKHGTKALLTCQFQTRLLALCPHAEGRRTLPAAPRPAPPQPGTALSPAACCQHARPRPAPMALASAPVGAPSQPEPGREPPVCLWAAGVQPVLHARFFQGKPNGWTHKPGRLVSEALPIVVTFLFCELAILISLQAYYKLNWWRWTGERRFLQDAEQKATMDKKSVELLSFGKVSCDVISRDITKCNLRQKW